MRTEQRQKELFDSIFQKYAEHYDDACSQRYRAEFIYKPLFQGIDLAGCQVLEAMCGTGQTTQYLLDQKAVVTGLDISENAITSLAKRWPDCHAICASLLQSNLDHSSFDCVVIIGGLHHLHPDVPKALDEIYRVLKPGGYFCFVEPHRGSLPDRFRKIWYKHDPMFEDNEASIDIAELKKANASRFHFVTEKFLGNIAYLLVMQSVVLRMPPRIRALYAPILMPIEAVVQRFQGKFLSCIAMSQWRKS